MELLYFIIISGLFITGVNIATQEGYLLHGVKKIIEMHFINENGELSYWYNPVFGCYICMSSLRTIMAYILLNGVSFSMIPELLVAIPSVATVVFFLNGDGQI